MTVEGNDWRTSLDYFFFQYRSTPHSTTKESPAKLLMGRELRGKLPMVVQPDSTVLKNAKTRDHVQKQKSKQYFDKRFRSKVSLIRKGDLVLLKQIKKNKLTTTFDVRPFRVVSVKGTVAVIERDDVQIMRNMSLLKKISSDPTPQVKRNNLSDSSDCDDELEFPDIDLPITPRPQFPRQERPQRVRRPPPRYQDFQRY